MRASRVLASIVLGLQLVAAAPPTAAAATVLPGFQISPVWSGLNTPTAIAFAGNGRVFVAERAGIIKTYDSVGDPSATVAADLRANVHSVGDRGLLGLAVDPAYPTRPYVYVAYILDAPPGGTAPFYNDGCPLNSGSKDGCPATGRVSRLTMNAAGVMTGSEQILIGGSFWCHQQQGHALDHLEFGPDGALYASSGDGGTASFTDWGQHNGDVNFVAPNACGDPPVPAGTRLSLPTTEGGALRSQDLRTMSDPAGGSGAIVRFDPDTGQPLPNNPLIGGNVSDDRHVAYGLRNPFRFTFRPGTSELWIADVGWNAWEELNLIANPMGTPPNFGWPCYEGAPRQPQFDAVNVNLCESLYAAGAGAVTAPYWSYRHEQSPDAGRCGNAGSAMAALAFADSPPYPAAYDGALFVGDYVKQCLWILRPGANGRPDPTTLETLATGVFPVDLGVGPGGTLYFVDIGLGQVNRIDYLSSNQAPDASVSAEPTSGPLPLTVNFDATGSTDADGPAPLAFAWDLDGDGAYDDATGATPSRTYSAAASVQAAVRVTDGLGASDTATVQIHAGNEPPQIAITSPASTLRWATGDVISFSATASDAEDGNLTSAIEWDVGLFHCQTAQDCHEHPQSEFTGGAGTFEAPEHEYPAFLEFRAAVRDSLGATRTASVRVDPSTITLTLQSDPAGLILEAGDASAAAPFDVTVISGSRVSVTAPSPVVTSSGVLVFDSWSDGGAASHEVAAATDTTLTARYEPAGAGWTHIGTGALADSTRTGASVAYPSGTQAGDLLLLGCQGRNNAADWTATGFTSLARSTVVAGLRLEVLSAWASSSGGGSASVANVNPTNGWSCSISAFRGGAGSGSPLDAAVPVFGSGTGATMTAPGTTATGPGALVTHWYASIDDNDHGGPSAGEATAFGGVPYHTITGVDHASSMTHRQAPSAGSVGPATMSQRLNAADPWASISIVLAPASGSGPPNQPPVAVDGSATLDEDTTRLLTLAGTDADGDSLAFDVTSLPAHGSLFAGNTTAATALIEPAELPFRLAGAQVTYRPATDYAGPDAFGFAVHDGSASDPGTVSLTVSPVDDPPSATADAYTGPAETELVVTATAGILANDADREGDSLTGQLVQDVENGVLDLSADGSFRYTPPAGFSGVESFTYQAVANGATSPLTTVTLTITAQSPNQPPVAVDGSATLDEDTTRLLTLAGTDADGDSLAFDVTSLPAHGSLFAGNTTAATALIEPAELPFRLAGAQVTYRPTTDYAGPDAFGFAVHDGIASDPGTVSLTVSPVDDPPPPSGWTHVGTGTSVATTAASAAVPYPSGVVAGDQLLLACQGRHNAMDWSAAGFTSLARSTAVGGLRFEVLAARAVGSPPATLAVTNTRGTNGWSCEITALRGGVGTGPPMQGTPIIANGTGATMTAPTATVSTAGSLVTHWYTSLDDNDHGTPSAGETLAFGGAAYQTTTGSDHAMSMSHRVATTAGTALAATMQQRANAADAWTAVTIVLLPAAGP